MSFYALIDGGKVTSIFETDGNMAEMWPPVMVWIDITDMDPMPAVEWLYDDGIFSPPPGPSTEELANAARQQRDTLLRSVYDPGINMALRALRMADTPEKTSYAQLKVSQLDIYAEALQGLPEQPGFPQIINWPTAPTK